MTLHIEAANSEAASAAANARGIFVDAVRQTQAPLTEVRREVSKDRTK